MEYKHSFKNYEDYVSAQVSRSHTYDDMDCAVPNIDLAYVALMIGAKDGPVNCLDIGCRDAAWFDLAKKEFPFMVCKGIDISPVSVGWAVSRGRDVSVADARDIVDPGNVDLFVMSHSIEHIIDPEGLLKNLFDLSNAGAVLALRVPAGLEKGNGDAHCTGWDEKGIRDLITGAGWFIHYFFTGRGEWAIVATKNPPCIFNNVNCIGAIQEQTFQSSKMVEEYCLIMSDAWMKNKIDRSTRIKDKIHFIDHYLPEIKKLSKYVLDIGCGPSEFLEVCRYYRCKAIGIEIGQDSLMGDKYLAYSHLSHKRNVVDVQYGDFLDMARNGLPFGNDYFDVCTSQGAMNQILARNFKWKNKEGHTGEFQVTEQSVTDLRYIMSELVRITKNGGVIFIYPNGMTNDKAWAKALIHVGKEMGSKVIGQWHEIAIKFKVVK